MSLADLTDLDNFAHGFPHELFAAHRREAPVFWHSATEHTPDGEGFWSVAGYAETHAVLRDPVVFSSVTGGSRPYVVDVAAELPMQMICILLGVPESERHWLFEAIEPQFDFAGRSAHVGQLSAEEAGTRMYTYGQELIAAKRAQPTDDMLSVVANASLTDALTPLSDVELYLFFSLLFSAGAETTRSAVAGGLLALIENPSQLELLRSDLSLLPTAIEEMVRWTSPSPSKRRTATRAVSLGGWSIEPGQKVQVWEGSANRDSLVFTDPEVFDITRTPNPHLGFGYGIHYCLVANLARLELRVLFEELLARFEPARLVRPVEWTRSNRHTGIRHLVVELA